MLGFLASIVLSIAGFAFAILFVGFLCGILASQFGSSNE